MSNWYEELNFAEEVEITEDHQNNLVDRSEKVLDSEINNQGYGHSLNPAPLISYNVRHRAWYEALFTAVCIRREVLYFPLPLVLSGTQRIEPDAFIVKDGIPILVELDGLSHTEELASTEQNRLKPFRDNLVNIMRFPVPEDTDIDWANDILDQVLDRIEKISNLYGSKA
tara:strand:+ start:1044 stop:1553 length:510 start_codon:yes stop_codon:yes gene_type:complete